MPLEVERHRRFWPYNHTCTTRRRIASHREIALNDPPIHAEIPFLILGNVPLQQGHPHGLSRTIEIRLLDSPTSPGHHERHAGHRTQDDMSAPDPIQAYRKHGGGIDQHDKRRDSMDACEAGQLRNG